MLLTKNPTRSSKSNAKKINDKEKKLFKSTYSSPNRDGFGYVLKLKLGSMEYYLKIYEWSRKSWETYVTDDVQVQFYMVSPYVRKTMSTDQKGVYYTSLEVPDVYGVFQFKVGYEKSGVTSLSLAKQECSFEIYSTSTLPQQPQQILNQPQYFSQGSRSNMGNGITSANSVELSYDFATCYDAQFGCSPAHKHNYQNPNLTEDQYSQIAGLLQQFQINVAEEFSAEK
ncbi:Dolichyl-diphosphooligosaccharide--protein glycosyltransferase 48 kDa subunit [Capsicum chinense]|nr:Dolichyl-diphosphooligosaccharide--protein glycosyltransferase 48 kDa subunit [Capsicum chinense]